MHAVVHDRPGGPEVLQWSEVAEPVPGPDEVLLDVRGVGINRADLMQRQGDYPPPPGVSDVLGMECSGRIVGLGAAVVAAGDWAVGDAACALLSGGAYAERVVVPAAQLLPVPAGVDLLDAAALPEAAATVWSNLFLVAGLARGETLLVHGGASGIGTLAIQLGAAAGARVICTAGSESKLERCRELGAEVAVSYRTGDFVDAVQRATGGAGADVILDVMGASYLARNLAALAVEGRLVVIGLQGGARAELDLSVLVRKRAALLGTTLRARPPAEKATIVAGVRAYVWPLIAAGEVRPVVDRRFPLAEAAAAHRYLESGEHVGKVLLTRG